MIVFTQDPHAIVIHCSATPPNLDFGAADIREWHTSAPLNWDDIGYHRVITREGSIESGRATCFPGAHVRGHNSYTLAICMVGGVSSLFKPEDNFERAQFAALQKQCLEWCKTFKFITRILGHRDLPGVLKSCPCFSVTNWVYSTPEVASILEKNRELQCDGPTQ